MAPVACVLVLLLSGPSVQAVSPAPPIAPTWIPTAMPIPAPTEGRHQRVHHHKHPCERNLVLKNPPRTATVVVSVLTLAMSVAASVGQLPDLFAAPTGRTLGAPRSLVFFFLASCVGLGAFSLALATIDFLNRNSDYNVNLTPRRWSIALWLTFALFCRAWTVGLFRHTLWMVGLPYLSGRPIDVLVLSSRSEAAKRVRRTVQLIWGSFALALAFWIVVLVWTGAADSGEGEANTDKDAGTSGEKARNTTIYKFALLCFLAAYLALDLVFVACMVRLGVSVSQLHSLPALARRLFLSSAADLVALVFILMGAFEDFFMKHNPLRSLVTSNDDSTNDCIVFLVGDFFLLPITSSILVSIFAFIPMSPSRYARAIGGVLRSCAGCIESTGDYVEDKCCASCLDKNSANFNGSFHSQSPLLQRTPSQLLTLPGRNSRPLGVSSLFDMHVAAEGQSASAESNKPRSDASRAATAAAAALALLDPSRAGERQVLERMGRVLDGADVDPLIIPPDFLDISPRPVAAGGFAQVHKGVFAGSRVAVKKYFTQMLTGHVDDFNHEVRILNNLRGVPHVILLHGVSLQTDRTGEAVLIMVLEWCPLSLSTLIHDYSGGSKSGGSESTRGASGSRPGSMSRLSGGGGGHVLNPERGLLRQGSAQSLFDLGRSRGWLSGLGRGGVGPRKDSFMADRDGSGKRVVPPLGPGLWLDIARQLANVLHHLHYKGYVHRDIKPDNVLFAQPASPGSSLRLCDFGTSRITDATGHCPLYGDLQGISPMYAPPEVISDTLIGPTATASLAAYRATRLRRQAAANKLQQEQQQEARKSPQTSPSRNKPASLGSSGASFSSGGLSIQGSDGGPALPPMGRPEMTRDNSSASGFAAAGPERTTFDGRAYDLYSLGILMWEMWHQELPLLNGGNGDDGEGKAVGWVQPLAPGSEAWNLDCLARTKAGERPSPWKLDGPLGAMPPPLVDLMTSLWDGRPLRRPRAEAVRDALAAPSAAELVRAKQREFDKPGATRGDQHGGGRAQGPRGGGGGGGGGRFGGGSSAPPSGGSGSNGGSSDGSNYPLITVTGAADPPSDTVSAERQSFANGLGSVFGSWTSSAPTNRSEPRNPSGTSTASSKSRDASVGLEKWSHYSLPSGVDPSPLLDPRSESMLAHRQKAAAKDVVLPNVSEARCSLEESSLSGAVMDHRRFSGGRRDGGWYDAASVWGTATSGDATANSLVDGAERGSTPAMGVTATDSADDGMHDGIHESMVEGLMGSHHDFAGHAAYLAALAAEYGNEKWDRGGGGGGGGGGTIWSEEDRRRGASQASDEGFGLSGSQGGGVAMKESPTPSPVNTVAIPQRRSGPPGTLITETAHF